MSLDQRAIIVDTGSGYQKSGFQGDEIPTIFPTMMRKKKSHGGFVDENSFLFGTEVKDHHTDFKSPLNKGIVSNWNDMELFWKYTFSKLRLSFNEISNHPVLIPERPQSPKHQRERTTQILFEKFDVQGMFVINSGILGLYSSGKTSGLVVDVGEYVTSIVPILDGYPNKPNTDIIEFGANDINTVLRSNLIKSIKISSNVFQSRSLIRNIKERFVYVKSVDEALERDTKMDISKQYKLPDGNQIDLNHDLRTNCTEVIFHPYKIGNIEDIGLQYYIYNVLRKLDKFSRYKFYLNIVLSGGTTMFDGFAQRIKDELSLLAPKNTPIEVFSPSERKFGVWFGGSILSGLSQFQQLWVTKEEYNDWGPLSIDRKTF